MVADKKSKRDKTNSRAAVKSEEQKENKHIKELETRGIDSSKRAASSQLEGITNIIVKGREELQNRDCTNVESILSNLN